MMREEVAMSNPPLPRVTTPGLPWRFTSSFVMGLTGSLSRMFYYGGNRMEVFGLEKFTETLDKRSNVEGRQRGLITVSNHVSVIDDPLVWGVLPFRYAFNPANHRWSLGSYDICFKNRFFTGFFNLGQVLPTHRSQHSPHGGLFQPVMTQAIRLLSSQPFSSPTATSGTLQTISDPFTTGALTYSTNGTDSFDSPSYYSSRKYSWVHIFPEGRVHQHPNKTMRYFKWGISRFILESDPLPEIIPMFIDGNQNVMHESRQFPRFVPRAGSNIRVAFGDAVDGEAVFGELRKKWQKLVRLQKEALVKKGLVDKDWELSLGELTDGLKYGAEAVALRKEVTMRIRQEVLKVRRSLGLPDEDPKEGLVETWLEEGSKTTGRMKDGSWIGET